VVGDPGRLRQVIINLVNNAIKFTERGEVVLRVAREASDGKDVVLHFSIIDTGIGIPPEKQAMIFEAFTQVDASSTRSFGGTGLGLAITTQLVALMRGRIRVESHPAGEAPSTSPSPSKRAPHPLASRRCASWRSCEGRPSWSWTTTRRIAASWRRSCSTGECGRPWWLAGGRRFRPWSAPGRTACRSRWR
jgi:signal transduction histidine kinase